MPPWGGPPTPTHFRLVELGAHCGAGHMEAMANLGNIAAMSYALRTIIDGNVKVGEESTAAAMGPGGSWARERCRGCDPRRGSTCHTFLEESTARRRGGAMRRMHRLRLSWNQLGVKKVTRCDAVSERPMAGTFRRRMAAERARTFPTLALRWMGSAAAPVIREVAPCMQFKGELFRLGARATAPSLTEFVGHGSGLGRARLQPWQGHKRGLMFATLICGGHLPTMRSVCRSAEAWRWGRRLAPRLLSASVRCDGESAIVLRPRVPPRLEGCRLPAHRVLGAEALASSAAQTQMKCLKFTSPST